MKLNTVTTKTVILTYEEIQKLLVKLIEKKTGKKVSEVNINGKSDDLIRGHEFTFILEPEQSEQDLDQPAT